MKKKRKPYWEMNERELAAATREYDKPMPGLPGRPLTAADKKLHRAVAATARRKAGRPVKGEGSEVVAVSVERGLLKQADAWAKRRKLGRSQLFTEALKSLLASSPPKTKAG